MKTFAGLPSALHTSRLLSAIAIALTAGTAAAQAASASARLSSKAPPPAFLDANRATKLASAFPEIDRTMKAFAERGNVPGIAYGIVIDGKLAHLGVSGLREVSSKSPVDSASVFRIASMTKSFTALAILQLRDAGKLSLDAPAERYVPEMKQLRYATADAPRITVRDLLSHSAGFPEDNPWGDQQLSATDAQLSQMIARGIPFSTSPSTGYEYSNFGFAILGRIVQNVGAMPYPRYIRTKVLLPLGMTVTTLQAADVPPTLLAHGYRRQDGAWLEESQLPDGSFGPMGGMLTSVSDLGKWVGLMLSAWPARDGPEHPVLKRSSLREMQQVTRYNGGSAIRDANGVPSLSAGGYGYGLGVRQFCGFNNSVSHTGGLPGFGSLMRWLPDYGVGIVALGNLTYTGWGGVSQQAIDLLVRTGGMQPRVPQAAPVLTERRAQVTRLIINWSEPLADSLAAMNLYLDESKPRRQAAIAKLVSDAGGNCRSEGELLPLNALRGSWRMRCANDDLRVTITLAPTEPATVQFLGVTPMKREEGLEPLPVCR
ncbi:MAG: beta-lactamase family protein [Phycisphaerae bacterium]|nr:beta-lactamase family protein [Gemmatimonadaceae bacterium]